MNDAASDDNEATNEYLSKARNMLTNGVHTYTMGKDIFGKETKIITDKDVMKWCKQGSDQKYYSSNMGEM